MPEEVAGQKKGYWAGSLGTRTHQKVVAHMEAAVEGSDYKWIRQFEFTRTPTADLLFRHYGLAKWLEANHKEHLSGREIEEFTRQVAQISAAERKRAKDARLKEIVYRYCPHRIIGTARRLRNRMLRK
jgi:hypothetical protein